MIQLWKCKWRVLVIWKFTWFTYMQAVLICVPFACHVFGLKCAESSCRKFVICIRTTYCIFNCSKRLIRRFVDKELLRIVFHHCRNCLSLWFLWMKFHEWTRLFYYIIKGSPAKFLLLLTNLGRIRCAKETHIKTMESPTERLHLLHLLQLRYCSFYSMHQTASKFINGEKRAEKTRFSPCPSSLNLLFVLSRLFCYSFVSLMNQSLTKCKENLKYREEKEFLSSASNGHSTLCGSKGLRWSEMLKFLDHSNYGA